MVDGVAFGDPLGEVVKHFKHGSVRRWDRRGCHVHGEPGSAAATLVGSIVFDFNLEMKGIEYSIQKYYKQKITKGIKGSMTHLQNIVGGLQKK